jgi:hypothetical protein
VILTLVDVREDFQRSPNFTQMDSFRQRGTVTVCGVRPGPRAYQVDYQVLILAPDRAQQANIHTSVLERLSLENTLRINGVLSPMSILAPPTLDERRLGVSGPSYVVLAPTYVRIGTRMERSPRRERPWVRTLEIQGAPRDNPQDQEGIILQL